MDQIIDKPDNFRYKTTGERPLMFHKFNQTIMCPFQNKLPIVNKLTGQMQLEAIPCNETCPHFTVVNTLKDMAQDEILFFDIDLTCANRPKEIRLQVEHIEVNKSSSIIQG